MPYVKVTGYIEVPEEDYRPTGSDPLTTDGHAEVATVTVDDLEDIRVERDDRRQS